ncbi:hypothetical protein [Streptomyces sp. RerS4]|uniref:hypothetical protein n=1 Tax=Streptomyces sp. RerS4 TaxID=2942449 RepID=UPI00201C9C32|nr:hypothetical protein [Streptomyces sp. RerS4]UQX00352.1 hypothetical protein M4D82_07235 [Streptomyces sp. RerS4]
MVRRGSAHPWQLALVLFAVLAPLPPAIGFSRVVDGHGYWVLIGLTTAAVASPLFLHRRRAAFVGTAGVVGAVLVPWILFGILIGLGTFALSVPLLWAAGAADPRRRPVAAPALFAAGTLLWVAIVALPGFWWWR